jgi:hypothetical protein
MHGPRPLALGKKDLSFRLTLRAPLFRTIFISVGIMFVLHGLDHSTMNNLDFADGLSDVMMRNRFCRSGNSGKSEKQWE